MRKVVRERMFKSLAAALAAGHVSGCGLEGDPVTLEKVAVAYAYPDSLNVMATEAR